MKTSEMVRKSLNHFNTHICLKMVKPEKKRYRKYRKTGNGLYGRQQQHVGIDWKQITNIRNIEGNYKIAHLTVDNNIIRQNKFKVRYLNYKFSPFHIVLKLGIWLRS